MSWVRSLLPELRVLTPARLFGLALDQNAYSPSGVSVDQEKALTMSAMWGAVNLLSSDISALPVKAIRLRSGLQTDVDPPPLWMTTPNERDVNMTFIEHVSQVVISLLLDGNAFVLMLPDVGNIQGLEVLNPRKVDIKKRPDGTPYFILRAGSLGQDDLEDRSFDGTEVLHIPWIRLPGQARGKSPVEAQRTNIGTALAAEEFAARFFANGAHMSGVIEYPPGVEPNQQQLDDLIRRFTIRHGGVRKSHAVGALTSGAKFHEMSVNPVDSQLIEAQQWTVEQVARCYNIPPHMLGSQIPGGQAYASVEQKAQDYVTHAILPIVVRLEDTYSRLLPRGQSLKFNLNGLVRGDIMARWRAYRFGWETGTLTIDDILRLEDMDPTGDNIGTTRWVPLNYAPADQVLSGAIQPGGGAGGPGGDSGGRSDDEDTEATTDGFLAAVRSLSQPPVVNVAPPEVHVEPPVVNVAAPNVRYSPPAVNVEAPQVNVTTPEVDVTPILAAVERIERALQPKRHRVKRDEEGRILEVTEE